MNAKKVLSDTNKMKYKIKNAVLILPPFRAISSTTPAIGRRINISTHDKYKILFNIAESCFAL